VSGRMHHPRRNQFGSWSRRILIGRKLATSLLRLPKARRQMSIHRQQIKHDNGSEADDHGTSSAVQSCAHARSIETNAAIPSVQAAADSKASTVSLAPMSPPPSPGTSERASKSQRGGEGERKRRQKFVSRRNRRDRRAQFFPVPFRENDWRRSTP
jgi:hypothetical protein